MKKLIFILSTTVLIAGCGSVTGEESNISSEETNSEISNNKGSNDMDSNDMDYYNIGETAFVEATGNYEITLKNIYKDKIENEEVLRVQINIDNVNDSNATTNNIDGIMLNHGVDGQLAYPRNLGNKENHFPLRPDEEIMMEKENYDYYVEFRNQDNETDEYIFSIFYRKENETLFYFTEDDIQSYE